MKILIVSDLHYSLPQFDWLAANAPHYDLTIVAGDFLQLGSYVEADTQASVVEQYFRRICAETPLVVCSGNHDLVDDMDGNPSTEWLEDLLVPGLIVDRDCYETDSIRILSLPWWNTEESRDLAGEWLRSQQDPGDSRPVFWVHHAPPLGTRTSWNGKRDLGDSNVVDWIKAYGPALVISGHVHNAPYYPEGSWVDRLGSTVVVNGGRQSGDIPASIIVELENGELTWFGMEGRESVLLELEKVS